MYLWCTVSTDYTQVDVNVHSVYKLCKVPTNYAQCLQTILGETCMCTVSANHAQCLQTMHSVHRLYVYAHTHTCIRVYARIRTYL